MREQKIGLSLSMSGDGNWDLSQIQHFPNMKHKPHNLTFRLVAGFAAILAVLSGIWLRSDQVSAQEEPTAVAPATAEPALTIREDLNATDVLATVREKLDTIETLQCELYETIHLSDQRFYASGVYSQASGNRVRLEFRIFPIRGVLNEDAKNLAFDGQPEDVEKLKSTGEFTQVSDGGVLWTLWKNGDDNRLTRRNIREILEAADAEEDINSAQMLEDLGTGGLQALIARLQTGMEFGTVREQTVGQTRLLLLSGRWTEEARQEYFNITSPEQPLPEWLPDFVRLYVDADALLPRRIQYLKKHPNPAEKLVRPLITLDFRKMSINDALPEDWFVFSAPEGLPEDDLTQQTIRSIKQAANPATSGSAEPADGAEAGVSADAEPNDTSNP